MPCQSLLSLALFLCLPEMACPNSGLSSFRPFLEDMYEAPRLRSSSSILAPVRLQFLGVITSVLRLCCRLLSPPPSSLQSLFLLPQAPSCSRTSGQIWCFFLLKRIWSPWCIPSASNPIKHRPYVIIVVFYRVYCCCSGRIPRDTTIYRVCYHIDLFFCFLRPFLTAENISSSAPSIKLF